jgi:hypothetical protein
LHERVEQPDVGGDVVLPADACPLEQGVRSLALRGIVPAGIRRLVQRARWRSPESVRMSTEDRRFLIEYYAADVRRLESIIDRDLSAWLV